MAHQSALIAEDIHAYLKAQEEKSLRITSYNVCYTKLLRPD